MEWLETSTENCPIQGALDIVGEKWTLLILRDAFNRVRRFDDFRRHVGLSDPVLADRLRKLVQAGILTTRPYREPGARTRQEYRLTEKGLDLYPVLIALLQWGDRYLSDPAGPTLEVLHRSCGGPVDAVVRCRRDHEELTARQTEARIGPGARPAQAVT
ncbi:MAG TPA: helix-turn-helix domain-containing protein [Streptosporangiaceae bacterium]